MRSVSSTTPVEVLSVSEDVFALRHLYANPVSYREAELLTGLRNELINIIARIELLPFVATLDKQHRGGLPAGGGEEVVSKSRSGSGTKLYTQTNRQGKDTSISAVDGQDRMIERVGR